MTHIVDTVADLTAEWFTAVLREGGTIGEGVTVTSANSELVGTGQLGMVAQASLRYSAGSGPASLIVKLPSRDDGSRQLGAAMGVYEAEVRFCREIAPLIQARVPRMHWGALEPDTGRFTLVIDDLSPGSVAGDMVAGCSLEHARLAVMELVGLQAPCWDDPDLLERNWIADIARTDALFAPVPAAMAPFLDRFADRLEPGHIELVTELAPKAPHYTDKAWIRPFVVAHGDYRLDNMMFGVSAAAPAISIIDWQGTRLAPPLLDVAIFLGGCLSPPERRAHERDLLRSYHEGLLAAGVEGFSLNDCWEGYRRAALYPFLLTIAMSLTLEQTERGDVMWARLLRGSADLVQTTGAAEILS